MHSGDPISSRFPPDLSAVLVLTSLTVASILTPALSQTLVRVVVSGLFVLLAPGYATLAALFPESNESGDVSVSIDTLERIGLSVPLSFVIVPVVGLLSTISPLGFTLPPILGMLCIFVTGGCLIAFWRRRTLQTNNQDSPRPQASLRNRLQHITTPTSMRSLGITTVLIIVIFVVFSGAGYLFAAPGLGESHTELYLGNQTQSAGSTSIAYPTEYSVGNAQTLTIGVTNHEQQPMEYTLVSEIQRVSQSDESFTVTERQELGRYSISIESDQTWERQDRIRPTLKGEQLRLIYYLYHDSPPSTPSTETATQEVHLWVNVTAS